MTANSHITSSGLRPYLQRCGYQKELIQTNFPFQRLSVPLAAFADRTYDARSACIAVIDAPSSDASVLKFSSEKYRDLGAPVLFICCGNELNWCNITTQGVQFQEKIASKHVSGFFDEYQDKFSPQSIYRAKTLARLDPQQYQLSFVDCGLMPMLEGKMGEQLAGLIKRMLEAMQKSLGNPIVSVRLGRWLFQSAFWLLAARTLKDKEVKEFLNINLDNPIEALQKVHRHYKAEEALKTPSRRQLSALQEAAYILNKFGILRNLTIESLAYVYENSLIDKNIRKSLGIHATPSYLVDYIVWQLAGWIEEIPREKRVVLEPTCGHAPFLISAARLLREMVDFHDNKKLHDYLRKNLTGLEIDIFAREIARLSLTLADVPNPNGWKLKPKDVFTGKTLQGLARKSTILLCNPPFEDFTPNEQKTYRKNNDKLHCYNKAAEVLYRTLLHMPTGSVFGVILPQGFLHSVKSAIPDLRKIMLEDYELAEICPLPENVFTFGKHKSVVILGRKLASRPKYIKSKKICYRHIQKWDLKNFVDRYQAQTENIDQSMFLAEPNHNLRWPILREVWEYCQHFERLIKVAGVGQGLSYKSKYDPKKHQDKKKHLPPNAITISNKKFKGGILGYTEYNKDIKISEVPKPNWMSLNDNVIQRPRWGKKSGIPQLILNYIRVSSGPWRLKGMIDRKGRPTTSDFLVIRPKDSLWSLEILWAIFNSPFANAYAYCHSLEKHNLTGMIREIPLPELDIISLSTLNHLVKEYFELYSSTGGFFQPELDSEEAKRRMLAIDAEVMRLYNLPPRLERQVLDLFTSWERKGVDFKLDRYFPEGFDAWIPLHEYLSEEFQRSTVSFVKKWVEEVRSPEMIKALETAVEVFKED